MSVEQPQNTNERLFNSLVSWAELKTDGAKKWMKKKLIDSTNLSSCPTLASQKIKSFKKVSNDPELGKAIERFQVICTDIKKEHPGEFETESSGELLFLGELFQPFNFIPYLLVLWSLIRIWIIPISSMLTPILIIILPYFIFNFVIGKSLQVGNYLEILKSMAISSFPFRFNMGLGDNTGQGKIMFFISICYTIFQSIVQPYWSHKHLRAIDDILMDKGNKLIEFLNIYEYIYNKLKSQAGIEIFRLNLPVDKKDAKQLIAFAYLHPNIINIYVQCLHEIEVWMALTQKVSQGSASIVKWVKTSSTVRPQFELVGGYDPDVDITKCVPINIYIGNSNPSHYLLTGPNRGGKSTALRAIAATLYLSHAFGISLGQKCISSIFGNFYICLTPDDLPGKKSRFEREIDFCSEIVSKKETKVEIGKVSHRPDIVLIDELFHSTNPPDAEFSSIIFTRKLWKSLNILSIISTHLFDFVENAPKNIGRICSPARKVITDNLGQKEKLEFSYGLMKGVCKVSSVESLLQKARLIE